MTIDYDNYPWSASALRAALGAHEISVKEVLSHHLEVLSKFDDLNAVVALRDTNGLTEQSEEIQARIDSGDASPMLGIPCTVKDVISVKDMAFTGGSRLLAQNVATKDAPVVKRIRGGGALILGKTNCPEFGFGIGTANDLFGRTHNPWGPDLSPGGSSGGEAASVAAGISLVGVGSDFGGSIRWPAQCTGILGFRPTPGRVSVHGQLVGVGQTGLDGDAIFPGGSLQGALQVPGFLARTVQDLASVLGVASEPFGKGFGFASTDLGVDLSFDLVSVSVGWSDGSEISLVGDDVKSMMSGVIQLLGANGIKTTEVPKAFVGAREAFDDLRSYDELTQIRALSTGRENELTPALRNIVNSALRERSGYFGARDMAIEKRNEGLDLLEEFPLFLLPVAGSAATGHDEVATIGKTKVTGFDLMAHCRAVSLMASPVVSIPVSTSSTGLPLSVQVIGAPFQEHLVLALSALLERLGGGFQRFGQS